MASTRSFVYVEIDLPYCSLDFGIAPCTATGVPCFNTRNFSHDCGDPASYTATTQTVRFAQNDGFEYWPLDDVPTFPVLASANSVSAKVNPAVDMGVRAACTVSLDNSLSLMTGLDKNILARSDDFSRGTFLGKFKARNPYIFGSEVRVYRGGGDGPFKVEHYTVDNFSGPDNMGGMTINCVDFLKLTNGDSSQFPAVTDGVLIADINTTDTVFTVEPVGIGDIQYPASGKVAVGKEAMTFTRVGDVFTVVRDYLGELEEHKAGDNAQLIGEFSGETSADIIYDLITNYTPLDASYINLDEWQAEVDTFQNALYSCVVVKPEPVSRLINELVEQSGLIFYANVETRKIVLKVLRPVSSGEGFDENRIIGFKQSDNQRSRVSQSWVYYNQKNPFLKLDDPFNYYSTLITPTNENLYATESIKKVFSRWIPAAGSSVALDLSVRIVERYTNPPKEFSFKLFRDDPVSLGQGIIIKHRANEDAFGDPKPSPTFVTGLNYGAVNNTITAQEFIFSNYTGPGGGGQITLDIPTDSSAINLRDYYDTTYASLAGVTSVRIVILPGVYVGGTTGSYAIEVGDFEGIIPELVISPGAYVLGAGGNGAYTGVSPDGGNAINADFPVSIENNGTIAGGGGASGQGIEQTNWWNPEGTGFNVITRDPAPGLPGAGYLTGSRSALDTGSLSFSGYRLTASTQADYVAWAAGVGGEIGYTGQVKVPPTDLADGGELGQPGSAGVNGPGGAAGDAVHNDANITWVNVGTIIGGVS